MKIFCPQCLQSDFLKSAEKKNVDKECGFCQNKYSNKDGKQLGKLCRSDRKKIIIECTSCQPQKEKSNLLCLVCSFQFHNEEHDRERCPIGHRLMEIKNLDEEQERSEIWKCDICQLIGKAIMRRDDQCRFTVCSSCFKQLTRKQNERAKCN